MRHHSSVGLDVADRVGPVTIPARQVALCISPIRPVGRGEPRSCHAMVEAALRAGGGGWMRRRWVGRVVAARTAGRFASQLTGRRNHLQLRNLRSRCGGQRRSI